MVVETKVSKAINSVYCLLPLIFTRLEVNNELQVEHYCKVENKDGEDRPINKSSNAYSNAQL
jgi:hypothetical protein